MNTECRGGGCDRFRMPEPMRDMYQHIETYRGTPKLTHGVCGSFRIPELTDRYFMRDGMGASKAQEHISWPSL